MSEYMDGDHKAGTIIVGIVAAVILAVSLIASSCQRDANAKWKAYCDKNPTAARCVCPHAE